jgi:hypothetical protein
MADMIPAGGMYKTALQAAAAMGRDKSMIVVRAASFEKYLKTVALLLEAGADPNVQGVSFAI